MIAASPLPCSSRPASAPRQERLALEPSASLPRGWSLVERAEGWHLIRERDGADMGIMASVDFACAHAATLARIDAMMAARQEEAA